MLGSYIFDGVQATAVCTTTQLNARGHQSAGAFRDAANNEGCPGNSL